MLSRISILVLAGVMALSAGDAEGARRNRGIRMDAGQLYVGGRVGIGVPMALGRADDEVSFKDVASKGFAGSADVMWMQSPNVGVGAEVGYASYPYREQYWSGLNYRGSFDAGYKDVNLSLLGRVIMGKKEIKPYLGASFGMHYIRNSLTFVSEFQGTTSDESVQYDEGRFKMGYGLAGGIFYKVGSDAYLSIAVRLNIIPFLDEESYVTIDPYTYEEKYVVVNPHGNQNNLVFAVGLHFGVKKKTTRLNR